MTPACGLHQIGRARRFSISWSIAISTSALRWKTPRWPICSPGTGALGIEAVSRGARFCLLVDDSAESRALQRENIEALGLTGVTKIWRRDATDLGPLGAGAGGPFDLVFLDPPYRQNLVAPALKSLREGGWLAKQALLIAETSKGEVFDAQGFERLDTRDYGETEITFLSLER